MRASLERTQVLTMWETTAQVLKLRMPFLFGQGVKRCETILSFFLSFFFACVFFISEEGMRDVIRKSLLKLRGTLQILFHVLLPL